MVLGSTFSASCLFILFIVFAAVASVHGVLISDCDSAAAWSSGTVNSTIKVQGSGSLQWNHSTSTSILLRAVTASTPLDLSVDNAIQFWVYMREAKPDGAVMLQITSDNPATTAGLDYYSFQISLNFAGWKQFSILYASFFVNRSPLGWHNITGFQVNAAGWDLVIDPSTVMNFDNITTTYMYPTCETPDNDFVASLNTSAFPALSAVKSNWAANVTLAKKIFADYFRTRSNINWSFNPKVVNKSLVTTSTTAADKAALGTYTIVGKTYSFPSGSAVNWTYNPTINMPGFSYDPEWQWQLNRMQWWSDFGRAWWATGNATYSKIFFAQLSTFIATQPLPCSSANSAKPSAWRSIECGIRTSGSWAESFFRFLTSPDMTDDVLFDFVKLFIETGKYLYKYNTGGNWLTMEMNGLYTLAGIFPEFNDSPMWREYATERLYADMTVQILNDGAHYELSTGYHQVFLDNMIGLYSTAKLLGRMNEMPSGYLTQLQSAYEHNVKIMQPNGDMPWLNDAWSNNVPSRSNTALTYFPSSALLQFAAKKSGAPAPDFTSIYLPDSGRAVMRTGWTSTDTYALIDVGPLGYSHIHQDKLSMVMSSYGRPLLWDGGGGNYEDSKWRIYALSTYNHNTAVVDLLPQAREKATGNGMGTGNASTPAPIWQTTNNYDYIHGSYIDGYGTAKNTVAQHHREVMLLKGTVPVFVVVDRFIPSDSNPHQYTIIWNFKTTNTTQDSKLQTVISQDSKLSNFALVPVSHVSTTNITTHVGENAALLWGWDIAREAPFYFPATTVLHERTAAGAQYFVSLLVPIAPNATFTAANITSIVQVNPYAFTVAFTNAPQLNIRLNSNVEQGGIQVKVENTTYATPNFNSSESSSTTGNSATTSSGTVSTGGSPSSSSTTGGESAAAMLASSVVMGLLVLVALL